MSEPTNLDAAVKALSAAEAEIEAERRWLEARIEVAKTFTTFLAGCGSAIFAGGVVAPLLGWFFGELQVSVGLILVSVLICLAMPALLYFWAENEIEAAFGYRNGAG